MPKSTIRTTTNRKSKSREPTAIKMTGAQRTILSNAALRDDGAATPSEKITGKAAQKLAAALAEKGLVREVRAKAGVPVWRRGEDGRALALIVTKPGREAIKAEDNRQTDGAGADTPAASAIVSASSAAVEASGQLAPSVPRAGSKIAAVIALLIRKEGAGIEDLTSATSWLPHTTRAALTGLRKRGFAIERSRSEKGGSIYRIVVGAASALAA